MSEAVPVNVSVPVPVIVKVSVPVEVSVAVLVRVALPDEVAVDVAVAVVFVPPLKGVPVYGVTRWMTPEKALIQLSLRGKYEDVMWFTFFHEAAHILKHGKKEVFVESDEFRDAKEDEADAFAANYLIPTGKWNQFIQSGNHRTKQAVQDFADELDISPAIVVGRLQHEGLLPHSHMNDLRRRYQFKGKNH